MGISLDGCGLEQISSEDLRPFKHLVQVSLDGNRLKELPHDLFVHNVYLKRISIADNSILHVGSDIFSHLPQLSFVDLRRNLCTSDGSIALDEHEMEELNWELTVECPATTKMLTLSLFLTGNFDTKVREISKRNGEELRSKILTRLAKLEKRLENLRKRL